MTVTYEPDRNRFTMPTPAGDAFVTIRWDGDVMVLPHAEVPAAMRGSGAGKKLADGVFALIKDMDAKAHLTCPFLIRMAKGDPDLAKNLV